MTTSDDAERAATAAALAQAQQTRMRQFFHRRILSTAEGDRPLFLAPHPDDIVVGCGGVVAQYRERGVPMRLVYLTDGRAAAEGAAEQEAMATIRRKEAVTVAEAVGAAPPCLVDCPETEFQSIQRRPALVRALAEELSRVQPDHVYVPYLWDQHGDHRYTNLLLAAALREARVDCMVLGYEVWSFAPPGYVVDISSHLAAKLEWDPPVRIAGRSVRLRHVRRRGRAIPRIPGRPGLYRRRGVLPVLCHRVLRRGRGAGPRQ